MWSRLKPRIALLRRIAAVAVAAGICSGLLIFAYNRSMDREAGGEETAVDSTLASVSTPVLLTTLDNLAGEMAELGEALGRVDRNIAALTPDPETASSPRNQSARNESALRRLIAAYETSLDLQRRRIAHQQERIEILAELERRSAVQSGSTDAVRKAVAGEHKDVRRRLAALGKLLAAAETAPGSGGRMAAKGPADTARQ